MSHITHSTSYSDSNFYDVFCSKCGKTDANGMEALNEPCSQFTKDQEPTAFGGLASGNVGTDTKLIADIKTQLFDAELQALADGRMIADLKEQLDDANDSVEFYKSSAKYNNELYKTLQDLWQKELSKSRMTLWQKAKQWLRAQWEPKPGFWC